MGVLACINVCLCQLSLVGLGAVMVRKNPDFFRTNSLFLKKNSLLIFDVWNGLAVLRTLPASRKKIIEKENLKIIRFAEPELDAYNHICNVKYHLLIFEDNKLINEIKEIHSMRFLFPQEIVHLLDETGFETLKICPFLDLDGEVDENTCNISVIAKLKVDA